MNHRLRGRVCPERSNSHEGTRRRIFVDHKHEERSGIFREIIRGDNALARIALTEDPMVEGRRDSGYGSPLANPHGEVAPSCAGWSL